MNIWLDTINFYVSSDWLDPFFVFVHVFKFKQLVYCTASSHAWTLRKKLVRCFLPSWLLFHKTNGRIVFHNLWCSGGCRSDLGCLGGLGRDSDAILAVSYINIGLPSDNRYFLWRKNLGYWRVFRGRDRAILYIQFFSNQWPQGFD